MGVSLGLGVSLGIQLLWLRWAIGPFCGFSSAATSASGRPDELFLDRPAKSPEAGEQKWFKFARGVANLRRFRV